MSAVVCYTPDGMTYAENADEASAMDFCNGLADKL